MKIKYNLIYTYNKYINEYYISKVYQTLIK